VVVVVEPQKWGRSDPLCAPGFWLKASKCSHALQQTKIGQRSSGVSLVLATIQSKTLALLSAYPVQCVWHCLQQWTWQQKAETGVEFRVLQGEKGALGTPTKGGLKMKTPPMWHRFFHMRFASWTAQQETGKPLCVRKSQVAELITWFPKRKTSSQSLV